MDKCRRIIYVAVLCSIFFWWVSLSSNYYANAVSVDKILIECFYMNSCSSCNVEEELSDRIYNALKDIKGDTVIDLRLKNTFQRKNYNILKEYRDKYFITDNVELYDTIVFIGNEYIIDDKEFVTNLRSAFEKAAQTYAENDNVYPEANENRNDNYMTASDGRDTIIVYFYTKACGECDEVSNFLNKLDNIYNINANGEYIQSNLKIEKYDIINMEHMDVARRYFTYYQVPEEYQKTPILFIGEVWLSGKKEITEKLIDLINNGTGLIRYNIDAEYVDVVDTSKLISNYEAVGVFFTGLVNGLNPCSISMIFFFLSLIIVRNISILKIGFSFILGKFIAYLGLGTLFYKLFSIIENGTFSLLNNIFKIILLIIIAVIVFINIMDYYHAKKEQYGKIGLQLPKLLRKANHSWIKRISSIQNTKLLLPASFCLGIIISVGEFLCAGQLYLITIIQIIQNSEKIDYKALGYFITYGIALIIPMVLIVLAIHKGKEIFKLTELVRKNMHIIKLLNAVIFILFGVLVMMLY